MKGRPEPRKQPRQERSRALYDAILIASADLLESLGPTFTLEAVAERAGVSPGSLYQYFPNRAALVGALIDRQVAHDRSELARLREQRQVVSDPASLLVEGTLRLYGQRPALLAHMVCLLREVGRAGDVEQIVNEFVAELGRVVQEAAPSRDAESCGDAARAAVLAVLSVVRDAAQHHPEQLERPAFRARLEAMARAALL